MPANIGVSHAPFGLPPSGTALHLRAVVTGAAAAIGTFISGGLPSWNDQTTGPVHALKGVILQAESAQATVCYFRMDGGTASATAGFLVPAAPNSIEITGADVVPVISLFCPAGTCNVQVYAIS